MKNINYKIIFLMFCALFLLNNPCFSKEPVKILILPFNIHSEKDLSFLKNGIKDMLSTRLTKQGKVMPIDNDKVEKAITGVKEVNDNIALSLGKKFGVKYVIYGSLTVFGNSISTDANVLDTGKNKKVLTYNKTGNSNSAVITHINQFAEVVNAKVFGYANVAGLPAKETKPVVDESRRNPESLWTGKVENNMLPGATPVYGRGGGIWRSRNFKLEILGIAMGDIDGDGNTEIAFIDPRNAYVYRYANERFFKLGEIRGNSNDKFIAIDIADINENGKAEIFITNVNSDTMALRSFVLEWDGKRLKRIAEHENWYFRVIDVPGRGKLLMGQKAGKKRAFIPGIDELKWDGAGYSSVNPMGLPRWINVFGFNYGDISGTGNDFTVAFTAHDYLKVIDPSGEEGWESNDELGDSSVFILYETEASARIGEYKEQSKYYIPQRVLLVDEDNDGKAEVFVGRKKDMARKLFERLRFYNSGHIECLKWDKFGLYPKWRTREISGNISDYGIGDVDNDGKKEIVFAVIRQASSVLGRAKSYLAAQDINPVTAHVAK